MNTKPYFFALSVFMFIISTFSTTGYALDACPKPRKSHCVKKYLGSCTHSSTAGHIPVCTDFTGWAWIRTSARVRCLVAHGKFSKKPCSHNQVVGACLEALPVIKGLAEVHRVYAPQSNLDFLDVCNGFHGTECSNE